MVSILDSALFSVPSPPVTIAWGDMRQLLWCDPETVLRDRKEKIKFLRVFLGLFIEFCEAIEKFYFTKEYHLFDPHVGENLCQIRACQIATLATGSTCSANELNAYREQRIYLENTLLNLVHLSETQLLKYPPIDSPLSVETLLAKSNIFLTSADNYSFVFLCYFLTKFRDLFLEQPSACINSGKLESHLQISPKMIRRIVHSFQIKLSELSCSFVEKTLLPQDFIQEEKFSLSSLKKNSAEGREVFPFYLSSLAVVKQVRERGILNAIKVVSTHNRSVSFIFYDNNKLVSPHYLKGKDRPCIQWEGWSDLFDGSNPHDWLRKFESFGPEKLILANAAIHLQYPSVIFPDTPVDLSVWHGFSNSLKNGQHLGLGRKRRSLWSIRHVTCSSVSHIIRQLAEGDRSTLEREYLHEL